MGIETQRYVKKPLYVEAVRVTEQNFDELVDWAKTTTQAEVIHDGPKRHIKIFVHSPKNAKQTKAFIGDWLLKTDLGIKIYTNRAFRSSFDQVAEVVEDEPQPPGEIVKEEVTRPEVEPGEQTIERQDEIDRETERVEDTQVVVPPSALEDAAPPLDQQVKHELAEAAQTHEYGPGETQANTADTEEIPVVVPEEAGGRARMDVGGKRILTEQEQRHMTSEEVRDLLRAGEVVLEQDLAA